MHLIFANLITENTGVSVGLFITFLGLVLSASWWASSIQSKLDMLIKLLASVHKDTDHLKDKIDKIDKRVTKVEFWVENQDKNGK